MWFDAGSMMLSAVQELGSWTILLAGLPCKNVPVQRTVQKGVSMNRGAEASLFQ